MSEVHTLSVGPTREPARAHATQQTLAVFIVMATALFNLTLCFVNTTLFGIGINLVIGSEIALIAIALALTWYRGYAWYVVLLLLTAYFFAVMLIRSEFDAKIVRDLLIPIVFFFLGSHLGSLRSADRLVTTLIFIALGAALFEFLELNTYLHYFDVIHYYQARGTEQNLEAATAGGIYIKGTNTTAGLYINGTRFGQRELLSFLGEHRVSGIFLEPVSVGNFGAIVFAWVLLRDRHRVWVFGAKTLAIATVLVLADARFGLYLCIFTAIMYAAAPIIRPTMLLLAPAATIIAIVTYALIHSHEPLDNTMSGRFLYAGYSIATLDLWQLLGVQTNDLFMSGYFGNSGYGYVLVKLGLLGFAAIWGTFVYSPVLDREAWRFKVFVACYISFLLVVSASLFSIKTAGLLWFLYGTLNNSERSNWMTSPVKRNSSGALDTY